MQRSAVSDLDGVNFASSIVADSAMATCRERKKEIFEASFEAAHAELKERASDAWTLTPRPPQADLHDQE